MQHLISVNTLEHLKDDQAAFKKGTLDTVSKNFKDLFLKTENIHKIISTSFKCFSDANKQGILAL